MKTADDECSDPETCSQLCEVAEGRNGECVCAGGYTASGECMTIGKSLIEVHT